MEVKSINITLKKYQKDEFKTKYLSLVINYFKKIKNKYISEINDNELELTGIKIHLLYTSYKFVFCNYIITGYSYRKIKLNQKQLFNLLNQKYGLQNNDFKICNKITETLQDIYYIYIIHDNKIYDNMISYDLALVLLGIESLYFLNHQNLENYCSDVILNNSNNLFNDLIIFKNILNKIPLHLRDRIIIFSGLIYHFLGTLYTRDIDITIVCKDTEQQQIFLEYFNNIKVLYVYENKLDDIYSSWFIYKLPYIRNIENLYVALINPRYHFYFMGIKCIDIVTNFYGSTKIRANTVSINDTILLKKINNIDLYHEICIKNINIRRGKNVRLFTDNAIHNMYNNIIDVMKRWWNIDISYDYLKLHFKRCNEKQRAMLRMHHKFQSKYIKDILYYINKILINIIKKYNPNTIFYSGYNLLNNLNIFNKITVKKIYCLEKSLYTIDLVLDNINKNKKVQHLFNIINGTIIDTLMYEFPKVEIIILDVIQYYYNNIELIIKNILSISKKNTFIIVPLLNGTKVLNKLSDDMKIEILYNDILYFGVYPFNDSKLNTILVFFKDVYNLDNSSEEYLIQPNILIEQFNSNNIVLYDYIELNKNNKLLTFQKEILSYYNIYIFHTIN